MATDGQGDAITGTVSDSSNVAVGKNITTGQTVNQTFALADHHIGAADLAAWATANNVALDGLLTATYAGAKSAALKYIAGDTEEQEPMPTPNDGSSHAYLERRLDRLESKFDEQHAILQQIQVALSRHGAPGPPSLNWNIVTVAFILASVLAAGTYLIARLP